MSLLSIPHLRRAYLSGAKTPTGLVEELFPSIEENRLNAFISSHREKALKEAKAAEDRLKKEGAVAFEKYPLLGIPYAAKDLFTTEGIETTCASQILKGYIPPYSAAVIEKLREAGAVLVGKLNMDEFAMGGSNENSAFGPVEHPTHRGRVPGGSSGGSAAAVKAQNCSFALGTDTGGSIRLPASYCGVVGFKPTYGRVSRFGMTAFASSLDQGGPLTQTVEDAAIVSDVICGHDPRDTTSREARSAFVQELNKPFDWKSIRFGVPREYLGDGLSDEVRRAVEKSIRWLEQQGAKRMEISLPHSKYAIAVYYVIAVAEASSNLSRFDGVRFCPRPVEALRAGSLEQFYAAVRSQFGPEVKRRIILGTFALSSGYADQYFSKAAKVRRLIAQDFEKAFQQVDLIVGPVSPTTAFLRGQKIDDPLAMYLNDVLTVPVNLAGLPGASVVCGFGQEKLPIGLQWIGSAMSDEKLLAAAHAFEKAFPVEGG
jgi:aspartyl-tRNA(Asn)/glutamyl-tRNA(Gln) amidotransferase subunit A